MASRCQNGHEVGAGDTYCSTCAVPLKDNATDSRRLGTPNARTALLAVSVAVVLVAGVVAVVVATRSSPCMSRTCASQSWQLGYSEGQAGTKTQMEVTRETAGEAESYAASTCKDSWYLKGGTASDRAGVVHSVWTQGCLQGANDEATLIWYGVVNVPATALKTCIGHLADWVVFQANNSGYEGGALTFGAQSPIFLWIVEEDGTFVGDAVQHGEASAQSALATAVAKECLQLFVGRWQVWLIPEPPSSESDPAPVFSGIQVTTPTVPTTTTTTTTPSGDVLVPAINTSQSVAAVREAFEAAGFRVKVYTLGQRQDSCYPPGQPNGGYAPGTIALTTPSETSLVPRGSVIYLDVCPT